MRYTPGVVSKMHISIEEINAIHRAADEKKMLLKRLGIEDELTEQANIEIAQAATGKGVSRRTAKIARAIMSYARVHNVEPGKVGYSQIGVSQTEWEQFVRDLEVISNCGLEMDRDLNASLNIRTLGLRGRAYGDTASSGS